MAGLESGGMEVHRISTILPGYDAMRDRYRIPHDGHPSADAHRRIAEYLARQAFREPPGLP